MTGPKPGGRVFRANFVLWAFALGLIVFILAAQHVPAHWLLGGVVVALLITRQRHCSDDSTNPSADEVPFDDEITLDPVNLGDLSPTDRQVAMLDFAMEVSQSADQISEDEFETMRDHGFDDEDIWDVAAIASFFALSNRMANFTSMRANDEFYGMGRDF